MKATKNSLCCAAVLAASLLALGLAVPSAHAACGVFVNKGVTGTCSTNTTKVAVATPQILTVTRGAYACTNGDAHWAYGQVKFSAGGTGYSPYVAAQGSKSYTWSKNISQHAAYKVCFS